MLEKNYMMLEKDNVILEKNETMLEKDDIMLEKNYVMIEKNYMMLEKNETIATILQLFVLKLLKWALNYAEIAKTLFNLQINKTVLPSFCFIFA